MTNQEKEKLAYDLTMEYIKGNSKIFQQDENKIPEIVNKYSEIYNKFKKEIEKATL